MFTNLNIDNCRGGVAGRRFVVGAIPFANSDAECAR